MKRAALAAAAVVAHAPALASIGPLRRHLLPGLSGVGPGPHIALTYDDGPDPATTPYFLDLLEAHGRTATFFLLGAHAARHPVLVAEMAARGHELAVHGWDHTCVALKRPGTLARDLRESARLLEQLTGEAPRWYRPPYGVLTTPALYAARAAGLRTVLWTAWGRDWEAGATPARIVRTVERRLAPGGTVLLHDTDRTSAPRSWERTLAASAILLDRWDRDGQDLGPLRDHGCDARLAAEAAP
ncbi:peptidoglycan/xylan/chitin deacetylase (PgdA/CDA1 family) [Nocardioides ginsengisegetis]|uniref:Peptidoglycan/xylan/chitin deacetylase (PgdA/CDA1 family) n=1 Tax=Nocardioides ginsengisegetis TaxID=661491 RepID=A0A7W3J3S5_9ACTN|nr:polysaccharide deacetylase family protein [Nocardioides ginsengisegetis]MBA8805702.1 peptidoglycan/xylan/chitin deacetylase (PgdA/CDA1 family) [Nocardioides ginsengisegetis]